MNAELMTLFQEDQEERREGNQSIERDRRRLARVRELLDDGAVRDPEDQFHAAMILHHGETGEEFAQAHHLAKAAFEGGYERARKLVALTLDRWLSHQGRPQRYGTQYLFDGQAWRLMEFDPTTSDEERAEWDVPPLSELLAMVDHLNQARHS